MKSVALNVALAVAAVVLAAIVVEVALRTVYPASERHYVLVPDQTLSLRPIPEYVPGVTAEARYETSSQGIRGPEMGDDDDYRILAIGGSTTQNAYLDQDVTWPILTGEILNRRHETLETWSGDVGRSGHTARSHLLQLRKLIPELPRIDAVVMLVGVNDLTAALRQGSRYEPPPPLTDPTAYRDQMRQAFVQVPGRIHDRLTNYQSDDVPFLKRTAIYHLLREGRNRWVQARGGTSQDRFGEIYAEWRAHRANAPEIIDTLPDLTAQLATYRREASEIALAARALDVRLIFMTQPVLWRPDLTAGEEALLWLGGVGNFQEESGHEYFSAAVLSEAMGAYNQTLLSVCDDLDVECFDLGSTLPSDTSIFYDDVHFTEKGSRVVASLLADYLDGRPPYSGGEESAPTGG